MFKLLWSAVLGGNPASWGIAALVAVMVLGSTFGAGFYEATRVQATATASVAVKSAKAQEKHDVAQHAAAVVVSNDTRKADVIHDTKIVTLIQTIHDQAAPAVCDLSPSDADALNKAASY
jgi:hypothetical protein